MSASESNSGLSPRRKMEICMIAGAIFFILIRLIVFLLPRNAFQNLFQ